MATVNPYLNFSGNCEEAFNFYQSVFGGEFPSKMRFKDVPPEQPMPESEGEKIMHVSLPIEQGTILMGSDRPAAMGPTTTGNNFYISINTESEEEAAKLFKGLSAGGQVMMPLEKAFWGAYFGMFTDKFGIQWMVNYDYNQMKSHQLTRAPVAKTEMLIRKPVAEVFEAFIDPAITSRFWFTKSSGRLEPGKQIQWDWEMYNISVQVSVKAIEQNKRILIEWSSANETPTTVEWLFTPRPDNTTFVSITNTGFSGDGDELVEQAIGSTEGFTLVLSGLKALLEHNVILNLVSDRFPEGLEKR